MLAKTYQGSEILTPDPYLRNNRLYVTIKTKSGKEKEVRWYSDREYARMYKEDAPKPQRDLKKILGFGEKGYIILYLDFEYEGDNVNMFLLRTPECKYHRLWGWYSDELVPNLPENLPHVPLYWAEISKDNEIIETKANEVVKRLVENGSNSEYIGEIGDHIDLVLMVNKVNIIHGSYGDSFMHIMSDDNGNIFVWTTATRALSIGHIYNISGTVKDFRTYRGEKQTILTRCKAVEREK